MSGLRLVPVAGFVAATNSTFSRNSAAEAFELWFPSNIGMIDSLERIHHLPQAYRWSMGCLVLLDSTKLKDSPFRLVLTAFATATGKFSGFALVTPAFLLFPPCSRIKPDRQGPSAPRPICGSFPPDSKEPHLRHQTASPSASLFEVTVEEIDF
jgi:hypothetical protein